MKKDYLCGIAALMLGVTACGSTSKTAESDSVDTVYGTAVESIISDSMVNAQEEISMVSHDENIAMIKTVYEKFVFGWSEANPSKYFTKRAIDRLKAAYDYDCEDGNCYGYWELRTDAQDGPEDKSSVTSVEPVEDGWYIVSFKDMGHPGKTRVKIVDGKIDDYKRM